MTASVRSTAAAVKYPRPKSFHVTPVMKRPGPSGWPSLLEIVASSDNFRAGPHILARSRPMSRTAVVAGAEITSTGDISKTAHGGLGEFAIWIATMVTRIKIGSDLA